MFWDRLFHRNEKKIQRTVIMDSEETDDTQEIDDSTEQLIIGTEQSDFMILTEIIICSEKKIKIHQKD